MLKGFRDFILRGNVIDLAVAVVVGAAFTNIVNSLVKNLLNPLIAAIVKKPDLSFLKLDLNGSNITYGTFLNDVISFVLIAAAVYFFFVLPINKLMAKFFPAKAAEPPQTRPCPECLADIPVAARRCSHCAQPVAAA
ncbi:large conductance mechanosensitive channel protein MscL [Silvibacterium dinghuense]|uniref:Large-conductance mechanosensitive channel n=1 Tax=Silvibacterium dinghuense TaxID=1560006 RepID=A0A4Q1SEW8_9BACT|nr:large conductance mechanosensitive channel protein MscL [Silvibacterium dinghuense]RXS95468.1 large conductance mechanosensitive channel protein MscL [Silvibacterium dinghuense]GGH13392.1 large-conductance mechanosensitive channel [Silvibacterium dinghuense]